MNRYILGDLWETYHDQILIIQIQEALEAYQQKKIYPFLKHRCNYVNELLTNWIDNDLILDLLPYVDFSDQYYRYETKIKQERTYNDIHIWETGVYEVKPYPRETYLFNWYKYWKREDLYRFIRTDLASLSDSISILNSNLDRAEKRKYCHELFEMISNLEKLTKWELIFLVIEIDNCGGHRNKNSYPQSLWSILPKYDEQALLLKWLQQPPANP